MESGSKSSRGFDDDEDEDDGFSRREGLRGEMTLKVDGRGGSGSDQRATTPRSKHSATDQRRRSKINDRFQILRELIPHSDQKRDKASFLFEVIEYVRFLQEKVQKYETAYPGWNEDSSKLMPWDKMMKKKNDYLENITELYHEGNPMDNIVVAPNIGIDIMEDVIGCGYGRAICGAEKGEFGKLVRHLRLIHLQLS